MHSDGQYTLQELADLAGVTVRTIRFYTTQGLLPPPLSRGRYAAYGEAHLNRLRLIGKLKRAYLPLTAILAQLKELTDPQIAALAAHWETADRGPNGPPKARPSLRVKTVQPARDPAAYVAQILTVTGQVPAVDSEVAGPRRRALLVSPALREEEKHAAASSQEVPVAAGDPTWRRIMVASGVELHLLLPLSAETEARLPQALEELRRRLGLES
jgi:DNA-binding transcriptional MerR regulator